MPPRKRPFAEILKESSNGKHPKSRRLNEKERPKPAHPRGQEPPHLEIPRVHPGEYKYTFEGWVMSRQGDVWRTPLEHRMEGPIRAPYIGVSHWRALLESLVEGPACGAQPGELEGSKSKRKAKMSRRETHLFQTVAKNRIIPTVCRCYYRQCARLNMCFR